MLERTEVMEMLQSWFAVSLSFGILLGGMGDGFLTAFIITGLTVGLGFLLHEFAHKLVALRYGCSAVFHTQRQMLILMVVMSFFGFIFAVPGGVFLQGRNLTVRNRGIIALVGPLVNTALALFFGSIPFFFGAMITPISSFFLYGAKINAWLGFFNLLPFFGMDGSPVYVWKKSVFFVSIGFSLLVLLLM